MTVYLVGAGPGDPGLLTCRGADLLARADVVLTDRLVDSAVLALVNPEAEIIDVGKFPRSTPAEAQSEINALLVRHARIHQCVVRLKGGDPFLFGRGGEEALALEAAGQSYEVVPGVSAALASAAAAGTPVTHRGVAKAVMIVTGHEIESSGALEVTAASGATLVVLMGVGERKQLAEKLIANGMSATTPLLVVERATTPSQRSLRLELGELADADIVNPATIVIGPVARIHLAGYEDRPLSGKTIVVTRAASQAGTLTGLLREAGAEVVELPVIKIAPPDDDGAAMSQAGSRIGSFAWVVLTSANAVDSLFKVLNDARDLGGVKVAAVGRATARVLKERGVLADLVPSTFTGQALVESFPTVPSCDPRPVLVVRASNAPDVVAEGIADLGWEVHVAEGYQTIRLASDTALPSNLADQLAKADAVIFTSSSTVTGFLDIAGRDRLPLVVASIGPVTSATARDNAIDVTVEAGEATVSGLLEALKAYWSS